MIHGIAKSIINTTKITRKSNNIMFISLILPDSEIVDDTAYLRGYIESADIKNNQATLYHLHSIMTSVACRF